MGVRCLSRAQVTPHNPGPAEVKTRSRALNLHPARPPVAGALNPFFSTLLLAHRLKSEEKRFLRDRLCNPDKSAAWSATAQSFTFQ